MIVGFEQQNADCRTIINEFSLNDVVNGKVYSSVFFSEQPIFLPIYDVDLVFLHDIGF